MKSVLFCFAFLSYSILFAQGTEPKVQEGQFTFDTDKPFTLLELEKEEEPIVTKRKNQKEGFTTALKQRKNSQGRALARR